MYRPIVALCVLGAAAGATGCARTSGMAAREEGAPVHESSAPARDRAAILAMAGGYEVTFNFEETLQLDPEAAASKPHHSGGHELVIVIANEPGFISLQHLLVVGNKPHVIKHWRQDWAYEPERILRYQGGMTWQWEALSPQERQGQWTQTVYQVDDSPRYAGVGAWRHVGESSYWESDEAWRPLPRREHTYRDDYDVLVGQNRHAITPTGWVHGQDNFKLVLRDGATRIVAWETGLNVYDRAPGYDFAPAHAYWEETAPYWEAVRHQWEMVVHSGPRFTLARSKNDEALWDVLFELEESYVDSGEIPATEVAHAIEARLADSSERAHADHARIAAP